MGEACHHHFGPSEVPASAVGIKLEELGQEPEVCVNKLSNLDQTVVLAQHLSWLCISGGPGEGGPIAWDSPIPMK